ncbi:MAG: ABC transporter ATP-binding protein [Pseudomonadota bacterium]
MANPGRPPDRDLARVLWLWRAHGRKQLPLIAIAFVFMMVEGSILGGVSYLMEPMFDDVFLEGSQDTLYLVGGGLFALFIIRAFASTTQRVISTLASQRIGASMRQQLLDHTMTLDGQFHARHPPGYMIERVQGDTSSALKGAMSLITGVGRDAVSLVVLFSVAISVDLIWTLIALVGIPLLFGPALALQRYIRKKSLQAREVAAMMSLRLDEIFHGISTVKLSRLESYQSTRYAEVNKRRIQTETKSELGRAMLPGLIDILSGLGILCVVIYASGEIIAGEKTVGEFMSFFTAIALAFDPIRRLGNLSGVLKTVGASIERVQYILDTKPSLKRPASPKTIAPGNLVFDDVHVAFDETRALDGLSFTAKAGEVTALVGASGAGKSTVFHTLTRLAPIKGGAVTLGGTDITEADPAELRGLLSVVSQETVLFDETLRENLTFGADVDQSILENALESAFVTDFLPNMALGLESPAGPRGSNLSGGQRQRIAIARALLRDAPILLLDEATSALDAESETKVQQALARLGDGRTTLVIAHRLSTIQDANRIVVMDRGRAVEEGTHKELLAKGGQYARLHALQFRD